MTSQAYPSTLLLAEISVRAGWLGPILTCRSSVARRLFSRRVAATCRVTNREDAGFPGGRSTPAAAARDVFGSSPTVLRDDATFSPRATDFWRGFTAVAHATRLDAAFRPSVVSFDCRLTFHLLAIPLWTSSASLAAWVLALALSPSFLRFLSIDLHSLSVVNRFSCGIPRMHIRSLLR